jgi:hypothetical protein
MECLSTFLARHLPERVPSTQLLFWVEVAPPSVGGGGSSSLIAPRILRQENTECSEPRPVQILRKTEFRYIELAPCDA